MSLPDGFIPVLTFHDISDSSSPWCLPPRTFRRLTGWLADEGFRALTMSELAVHYDAARRQHGRAVALTFDDGRAGVYEHARETLARHGMRATIYAVSGWAHGAPLPPGEAYSGVMDLAGLRALAGDGHEIGYHSSDHRCYLTRTDDELRHDLTTARAALERGTGVEIRHFSYPYGHFDPRTERLVSEHGNFDTVVTSTREIRPDPRRHPRISVKAGLRARDFPRLLAPETWQPLAPVLCRHRRPPGQERAADVG